MLSPELASASRCPAAGAWQDWLMPVFLGTTCSYFLHRKLIWQAGEGYLEMWLVRGRGQKHTLFLQALG